MTNISDSITVTPEDWKQTFCFRKKHSFQKQNLILQLPEIIHLVQLFYNSHWRIK